MDVEITKKRNNNFTVYVQFICIFLIIGWSYWPPLIEMTNRWNHDPQYTHGYLVPVFSIFLLWLRKKNIFDEMQSGSYWGFVVILVAISLRLGGTYFNFSWLDPISILPMFAGIVLLFRGWKVLRLVWPAVAFLFFMIPLPYNVSIALAVPLQRVATEASTFFLQVMGSPAVSEGNVILLNEFELGVVEACSGLRMLMVFFAISTAVAMFINKTMLEKCFIVTSAIPIAIFANVLRITITGVLYESAGKEYAELVFHDLAGWLMMPLALLILLVELYIIKKLWINYASKNSQVFTARIKRSERWRGRNSQQSANELTVAENSMG